MENICDNAVKPLSITQTVKRRRGGLVVSALDFQSGGWGFEPGLCRRVVSLDKKLYSTLSLFTQVYKWVLIGDQNSGGGRGVTL